MRVLPGIESAEFDIPTEVFTLKSQPAAETQAILAAIRALGYEPKLLEGPTKTDGAIKSLSKPASNALKEALARAKARDVPLVVDFGAVWCGLCKKFAATTLTDERVEKALGDFEFLKIDVDEDPAAAKDFDVAGIPDVWFVAPDGRILGRENRYMDAEEFLAVLARMEG